MEYQSDQKFTQHYPADPLPVDQPLASQWTKANPLMPIVVILLVSLVFFGLGGYYLGKQSQISQKVMENIVPSPILTSSSVPEDSPAVPAAPDPTANWETYSSAEYTFKHPTGLKSDTEAAGKGAESIRFQLMGSKQIASGRTETSLFDGYSFVVTKIGLASEKTPVQWAAETRSSAVENCGPEVVLSDVVPVTLGKGIGVRFSAKNCMGDYTTSYVSKDTNVYEITQFYTGEPADQQAYEEITNQMFNSLKFL